MRKLSACVLLLMSVSYVLGQQNTGNSNEKRVPLTEAATALDAQGSSALEATLATTGLNGAPDAPVTNIRMVVRNSSSTAYAFVSGLTTFYDAAGIRCGEGIFKADAVAANESFETDTPGIRIRCTPVSWRIVATNLLPRVVPSASPAIPMSSPSSKLIISVDGEEHPIQFEKPFTFNLANKQHTIVIREAP